MRRLDYELCATVCRGLLVSFLIYAARPARQVSRCHCEHVVVTPWGSQRRRRRVPLTQGPPFARLLSAGSGVLLIRLDDCETGRFRATDRGYVREGCDGVEHPVLVSVVQPMEGRATMLGRIDSVVRLGPIDCCLHPSAHTFKTMSTESTRPWSLHGLSSFCLAAWAPRGHIGPSGIRCPEGPRTASQSRSHRWRDPDSNWGHHDFQSPPERP